MNHELLTRQWLHEEQIARIRGWDFSHLDGRFEEAPLPWSYPQIIRSFLRPGLRILDMDTGGGEFLLSLDHPPENTAAIEAYPPNVQLCRETLLPLGVDFREAAADGPLPFEDESFDLVLNRHGSFCAAEIHRILKPYGLFITQQVGAENDRELVEALYDCPPPLPYPRQRLALIQEQFEAAGFLPVDAQEVLLPIRFFDVGALVWFARIIQWEFPGFCVLKHLPRLLALQEQIEAGGEIRGRIHRILLVCEKKSPSDQRGGRI